MRRLPSYLFIIIASIAAGCGIFDTRTPEPPTNTHSEFIPPTTPEIVLQNFQYAIRDKDVNNYMRCFVDTLNSTRSYRFIPTASASSRFPTVFSAWSLQSEKSWFNALMTFVPESSSPSLTLLNGVFTGVSSDSATYYASYQLTIPHGLAGVPELVQGNLQLVIGVNRSTYWEIATWLDLPRETEASWSDLKGRFAN
jgi:hypothetical protein